MDNIKWMVLKKACEFLLDNRKKVNITLSTTLSDSNCNAILDSNAREVNIYLNGLTCKSLEMVIEAVAHEIAHEIINDPEHEGNEFAKKKAEAKEFIMQLYYSY